MSEMNRWSPWSLAKMEECGERYRRSVIERDYRPSSPAAARGRAVHVIASEANRRRLEAKRASGRDRLPRAELRERLIPPEEVRALADDAFSAAVTEGVALSIGDKDEGKSLEGILRDERAAALGLGEGYMVGIATTVDPVAVEREITAIPHDPVTGETLPFEVKGRIDLIDISDGPETIRDTKTSAKAIPQNAADASTQLTMYALLRTAETGVVVDDVALDNLVRTPTGKTSATRQRSKRGPAHFSALLHRMKTAEAAVGAGVFVPNTDSWRCSPKWCEYFGECKYVVHKPVQFRVDAGLDLSSALSQSIRNPYVPSVWVTDPPPTDTTNVENNNEGEGQ